MNSKLAVAVVLSALLVIGISTTSVRNAYAHTFSGDESASFLATVEVVKVHLALANSDFATNTTMSAEHVEHAGEHLTDDVIKEITEKNNRVGTELPASIKELQESLEGGNPTAASVSGQVSDINDLLDEAITVRIEKTQLSNSTVQGTMLANLIDEVLESYSGAYGVEEENDGEGMNMTQMGSNDTGALENKTSDESEHSTIVNMMEYEGAQALAARAQELFDSKLKAMAETNATEAVAALDAGLKKLKQSIDDKAPLDDVTVIVHSDVQANIQKAYNLQIVPEFPWPLLTIMMGVAGLVAYSRLARSGM
jgi:hypothetical protein